MHDMEDVEEAIRKTEQVIDAATKGHPTPATYLNNVGGCLNRRFICTDSTDNPEKAIRTAEMAVEAIPKDHPN